MTLSRRAFMQISALGAAAAAAPWGVSLVGDQIGDGASHRSPIGDAIGGDGGAGDRRDGPNLLVILELQGGADGFSTIVPVRNRHYRKRRSRTAVTKTIELEAGHGWHPNLKRIAKRGAAGVLGVGVAKPDLSHFEMMARWWAGAPDANPVSSTGFLGRVCDAIGERDAAAVGLSLGGGPTPALAAERAATMFMETADGGGLPLPNEGDDAARAWRAATRMLAAGGPDEPAALSLARAGVRAGLHFGDAVGSLPETKVEYPGTDLANRCQLAARLLSTDLGLRVVHIPWGSFDTHSGHTDSHASQLADLDAALDTLLTDLGHRGIGHRVVIATTSEFGRRAEDNGSNGLDHGTASNLLVIGEPVRAGLHGRPVRWDRLDSDGNLQATVAMTDYYASLARWMDVDPLAVLPHPAHVIDGLFRV